MAQGLRSRRERQEVAARRAPALALLLLLAACDQQPANHDGPRSEGPDGARAVDVATIAVDALPEAILDECHRPLRKRMERVKARVSLSSGRELMVSAHLPDRARVREGRSDWLVTTQAVQRIDGSKVTEADARLLRNVLATVDAAAFGPLHRARSCTQTDGGYTLQDRDGAEVTMTLFAGTLLPASFARDGITIAIEHYLDTPSSWVARMLRHPHAGICKVVFEDGGVQFPNGYFEMPNGRASDQPEIRTPIPGAVVETQSATPIVVAGKATQLVVLPDPGDWQARHEAYQPVVEELQVQEQRIAGFPCIFVDDASRGLLAVPFRQRKGRAPFDAPEHYWLSDVPKGRLLVVYPPGDDIGARIEKGRKQLQRALANRKLTAQGPIIAQPFVHLHEGPPDEQKRRDAKVRVWVRIE